MNMQEIFSEIVFIKLKKKNYIGDGLDLKKGDIALVSNEKCHQVMHDFPGKFEKIDFKDIPIETYKGIYDNKNKFVEKDDGKLIFDTMLFKLLIENPIKFKEYSEKTTPEKEDLPKGFDEELAGKIFEKESEKLWRDTHSQKDELLNKNRTSMGILPSERYTSILEVYTTLGEKLAKLRFDKDKVVLKKNKIVLDSNIHPFLIQRIGAVIHQWAKTSEVVIQELLPNSRDVNVKTFLVSQLKEKAKNINSNFERDLDIDFRLSSSVEEHSSSKKNWFWWGIAAFIGAIAGILYILEYFNIRP